jgi:hypothetical protein
VKNKEQRENLDEDQARTLLQERYGREAFAAVWQVAFGMADKHLKNLGSIKVKALYEPLSEEDIEAYF